LVFVGRLNIGLGPKTINGLAICSKNKFGDYHAWNRIEKLMSKHYTNFQNLKKLCEKQPTYFQTLIFCRNPGFRKSWICQWIFKFSKDFPPHGFPTPWILDFRRGRGSGRQKPRLDAKAESLGRYLAADLTTRVFKTQSGICILRKNAFGQRVLHIL